MKRERASEIAGVALLFLSFFLLLSLVTFHSVDLSFYSSHPQTPPANKGGVAGAWCAFVLRIAFGGGSFLAVGALLFLAACLLSHQVPERKLGKLLALAFFVIFGSSLASALAPEDQAISWGGLAGYLIGSQLARYCGRVGSFLILVASLILSGLLASEFLIYPRMRKGLDALMAAGRAFFGFLARTRVTLPAPGRQHPRKSFEETLSVTGLEKPRLRPSKREQAIREISEHVQEGVGAVKVAASERKSEPKRPPAVRETRPREEARPGSYVFPTLDLLAEPGRDSGGGTQDAREGAAVLTATFRDFGIDAKVVHVEQGPVITRYEVLPAPGVRVQAIAALGDDLALALKAQSVRFLTPIPGKSAVGVEVPNTRISQVALKELLAVPEVARTAFDLPLVIGKDASGKPLVADLADMPHLLVAGTTGSGKTVCINALIAGLLYHKTPEDLKFVMVDPKMVELALYNRLPHLLTPVVTEPKKAAAVLQWLLAEMEARFRYFSRVGVRNIKGFNTRERGAPLVEEETEEAIPDFLPYIVLIIDELADLMMVASADKVEGAITRLAQLSRAVGIHMILATQRPSVDVITGVIKANFPARISFKVAQKVDSRTVLDANGADKLIGKGDMLFLKPGVERPIRAQGAFVTDTELENVVSFIAKQKSPEFSEIAAEAQEFHDTGGRAHEQDDMYGEAVRVVLQTGVASTSMLQRRLRLGYTRAARLMDVMQDEGIVGPQNGAKPREILKKAVIP